MSISDDQMSTILTDMKESLGRIEGTLTATIKAHDDRFEAVEETMKSNDTRQWIVSACIIPVVAERVFLLDKIGDIKGQIISPQREKKTKHMSAALRETAQ